MRSAERLYTFQMGMDAQHRALRLEYRVWLMEVPTCVDVKAELKYK